MSTDPGADKIAFPISGGPVLVTYALPQGDLIAWCGDCRKWRRHGVSDGHRVSHCTDPCPTKETGYELLSLGPAPRDVLADIKRARPRGPATQGDGSE